jgi:hypothetical protein
MADKILKFNIQPNNLDQNIDSLINLNIHQSSNVIEKTLNEYEDALKPIQNYMHMLIGHMRGDFIKNIIKEIGEDVNNLKDLETKNNAKFETEVNEFNKANASTQNVKITMFSGPPKKNNGLGNVVFGKMTRNDNTPIKYFSNKIVLYPKTTEIYMPYPAINEIESKYYINKNNQKMTTAKQIFSKLPSLLTSATKIQKESQSSGNEKNKTEIDAVVKNLTDYQARLTKLDSIFTQKHAEYKKAYDELSKNETITKAINDYNKLVDDLEASAETMEATVRNNTRTYKDAYKECCEKKGGKPKTNKTSRKYRRNRTIRRRKSNRK